MKGIEMQIILLIEFQSISCLFNIIFLQKLHTLFNLSDVLSRHHPGCSNTLRDDKLPDEVRISYVFVVLLQRNHCSCLQEWSLTIFSYSGERT